MLEISIKSDEREIHFLRISEDIDTEALVTIFRAAIESHKANRSNFGQPNEDFKRNVTQKTRRTGQESGKREMKMTGNAKSVLYTLSGLEEPFREAREILSLVKSDRRFNGESVETVRHYLREFAKTGLLEKLPDGRQQLTPKGRDAAKDVAPGNATNPDDLFDDLPFGDELAPREE